MDTIFLNYTRRQEPQISMGPKFPYAVIVIAGLWVLLGLGYIFFKWRQKSKIMYIIPRVFVLCSPRSAQFHYELILRIGLASPDFNPDKHDIDITILGTQKNEVVPMTRLNTKTLYDEPLITSLSIVAYRLVEMPPLGGLILKHSGPMKSYVYAYDFTVIDLATNREQYYPLNKYIGSLNRLANLGEPNSNVNVFYPIDDVPLPQWTTGDIVLLIYSAVNYIMLGANLMPINCNYINDMIAVILVAFGGGTLVAFLDWLIYYKLRWNQDRKEYFNEFAANQRCCTNESTCRILIIMAATIIGIVSIIYTIPITDYREALVWLLVVVDSCIIVIGTWNAARQADVGESIVSLGLKLRGIAMVTVGMRLSDIVSEGSDSDQAGHFGASAGGHGSTLSAGTAGGVGGSVGGFGTGSSSSSTGKTEGQSSKAARSFGPRSSVKSYGFETQIGVISGMKLLSGIQRASSTGATPNNYPAPQLLRRSPVTSTLAPSKKSASTSNKVASSTTQQVEKRTDKQVEKQVAKKAPMK